MKLITIEEIMSLYKKCGVDPNEMHKIRTDINTGTLPNRLATEFHFVGKTLQNSTPNSQFEMK